MPGGPVDVSASPHARLQPLGGATVDGGFWAERRRVNREVLLPGAREQLEAAGSLDNLRAAAGGISQPFQGMRFSDSDVHKWLEALGWELGREPSEELARLADDAIELVEAAQEDDGYLNSYQQVTRGERYADLAHDHELYCAGHLIQAAIAQARGRGEERLLAVARRFADHLDREFGPGRREGTDGHPEIETALVELYRLTGERRYLELAGHLVDVRGRGLLGPGMFGPAYFQDHLPVREADEVTGHAVRQLYLDAGVTDVFLETGEAALMDVVRRQWEDMAGRKTYLTGGLGAHHADEAFGEPYELPPDRCYGETCAAIASIQWSWRMLLATGEARFADLLERTLYNGFIAGLALDGSGYAYVNPLQVRERGSAPRYPWFPCACCPPNVMRLLASLHHYLATAGGDGLQIHQYVPGSLSGGGLAVRVATDYPWDGRVQVELLEGGEGELALRVPGWAVGARLDGREVEAGDYARVRREWRAGDRLELELPVAPRLTAPHPRIDAVRGCLAIERGPLVYCLEHADNGADGFDDLAIDPAAALRDGGREPALAGAVTVTAKGRRAAAADEPWPYRRADRSVAVAPGPTGGADANAEVGADGAAVDLVAIPYAVWGNRGDGPMRVWIPA